MSIICAMLADTIFIGQANLWKIQAVALRSVPCSLLHHQIALSLAHTTKTC